MLSIFMMGVSVVKHVWLPIEAGKEVNRSIELVDDNGTAFDLDFEDTSVATLNIIYRRY